MQACRHMTLAVRNTPPGPCPLLYLQARVKDRACWALLDSGEADNFVANQIVKDMHLNPLKLGMPLAVSVGIGEIMYTNQYVSEDLHLDKYRAWTYLKVLETPIPMVLGYPFLLKHHPDFDRVLRFVRRGKEHFVQVLPGHLPADLLTRVFVEFKDPGDLDASSSSST